MAATNINFVPLFVIAALLVVEVCSKTLVVQTDKGPVAGVRRVAADGSLYASFRGVPYAKQPLGALRFQELQPADAWEEPLNATVEGPVCPQFDPFYGRLPYPNRVMNESCIHANIYVPYEALPKEGETVDPGLPILVFIHGGGFAFGSGDADLHGPEYLVSKGIIIITFNYRLNIFGFLSLNSSVVPGNNGMRDALTLLRWVQTNAASFGGNPNDVTVAGQSAGASITHLLSMVPAAQGLLHKIILMSSTASPLFYSASPVFAQTVTNLFLTSLAINSTDPQEIHNQLIELPIETLMTVNTQIQTQLGGVVSFSPVVEVPSDNFTPIIDIDADEMIKQGRGNNIPALIGFTSLEAESFRPLFAGSGVVAQLQQNLSSVVVYPKVAVRSTPEVIADITARIQEKYFPTFDLNNYIKFTTDAYLRYAAISLSKIRAEQATAPTYLYQFSYDNANNIMRKINNLTYDGSGASHLEDQTYVTRVNSALPATQLDQPSEEDPMVERLTSMFANFITTGAPTDDDSKWKPVSSAELSFLDIVTADPDDYRNTPLTGSLQELLDFFSGIESS